LVAQYFKVDEEWASNKETNTVQTYFELLCLVKEQSTIDKVWISFWEGMHRHTAIIITLLCADITYNTKNCYIPCTLQKSSFNDYIKGYTDTEATPFQIIQAIFDGTNVDAKMLKTVMNVMAYIPQKTQTDIATLMEVIRTQSQHVSENKLTSVARTLSTTLSDWLKLCSPNSVNSVIKKPVITHTFHLQTAIGDKAYQKKKEKKPVMMTMTTTMTRTVTQTSVKEFQNALIMTNGKLFWLTLSKLIDYMSSQKNVFSQMNNVMTKIKIQNYFREYNKRCLPNFKWNTKTGCSTYECLPNYPWNNLHASSKTTWGCSQKNSK
jgi:hypothetical protein